MDEAEKERSRWVLNRGLRMGKQIVVAGFLASSVPVVLPPLLVVSLIGISFSIPFGLLLASHVCICKLMNQLLSLPTTPLYVPEGPQVLQQKQTKRGIEMEENEDGEGFANKNESQAREHIEQDDDRNMTETNTYAIDLHQESSIAMVNPVLYVQNSPQSEYSTARNIMSPSNNDEVMVNEEKLWKEINAIRVIVGYEGAPQASCIDELKNLYVVAGVEPPSLLNDSSNPSEIYDKLHFLMSILGVKSNGP